MPPSRILATTIALVTYIGFIFLTGMLSDRSAARRCSSRASVLFVVLTVPAFMLLDTGNFLVIVLVQILLGAMLTLNDGTLPSFLAEMFPTRVRYSGFAVSFNLSNALFGGTAPFMATLLIAATAQRAGSGLVSRGRRRHFAGRRRALAVETGQEAAAPRIADLLPHQPSQHHNAKENTMTITTSTAATASPNSSA